MNLTILATLVALCVAVAGGAQVGMPNPNQITDPQLAVIAANIDAYLLSPNAPRLPSIVRLAFHDCVGGCDGCIDTTNVNNRGLGGTVRDLADLYDSPTFRDLAVQGRQLTRADFWALVEMRAVVLSSNNRPGAAVVTLPLNFRVGRANCANGFDQDELEGDFPSALGNWTATRAFFTAEFGLTTFSDSEVVALLGAHSLGRNVPQNSGFDGQWVATPALLDNSFYRTMTDPANLYQSVSVNSNRFGVQFQWNATVDVQRARPQRLMLNSDMSLLLDFKPDAQGAVTSCTYASCAANAATAPNVRTYANSQATFYSDFGQVFTKLLEHGAAELTDPASPASPSPTASGSPHGLAFTHGVVLALFLVVAVKLGYSVILPLLLAFGIEHAVTVAHTLSVPLLLTITNLYPVTVTRTVAFAILLAFAHVYPVTVKNIIAFTLLFSVAHDFPVTVTHSIAFSLLLAVEHVIPVSHDHPVAVTHTNAITLHHPFSRHRHAHSLSLPQASAFRLSSIPLIIL